MTGPEAAAKVIEVMQNASRTMTTMKSVMDSQSKLIDRLLQALAAEQNVTDQRNDKITELLSRIEELENGKAA